MRSFWTKIILTFIIVFLAYAFYRRNIYKGPSTNPSPINNEVYSETSLPEDFKIFYERFQSDTAFQLAHIVFPLKYISDTITPIDYWTADTWIIHRPFNDHGGTFERSFISAPSFVTEHITDKSGAFTMMRRYAKLEDGWHLVYYAPIGQYGQQIDHEAIKIEGGEE